MLVTSPFFQKSLRASFHSLLQFCILPHDITVAKQHHWLYIMYNQGNKFCSCPFNVGTPLYDNQHSLTVSDSVTH